VPSRRPSSRAPTGGSDSISERLATLRALLRLIDPESPFQPILLSSIDIVRWLAIFSRTAEQLRQALPAVPARSGRDAASSVIPQFLRLVDALCANAELHTFPPAAPSPHDTQDIPPFHPASAMRADDADAIASAMATAASAFEESVKHRTLLCRTLSLTAEKLKKTLDGPDALLRLMKRRCRSSRPFRRQYEALAGQLATALAALPDPAVTPWEKCRTKFATVRHLLATDLLPQLDSIVTGLGTGTRSIAPQKATVVQAVTALLEAQGLAASFDAGLQAVQYHTLFCEFLTTVTAALIQCGRLDATPFEPRRLIDDIRRLGPEVIKKDKRDLWDAALPETDPYTIEVILAAIHHLERPIDDNGGTSTGKDTRIFGVSDADLATWLRGGRYSGADPRAEVSRNRMAEIKRVGRTLQHLRRVEAAFHDRRLWTPTHSRNADSTQHRLWTVNPLLAVHARIAERLNAGPNETETGDSGRSTDLRPRPTRRNRGTQTRSRH
jgi:hypothetical protein